MGRGSCVQLTLALPAPTTVGICETHQVALRVLNVATLQRLDGNSVASRAGVLDVYHLAQRTRPAPVRSRPGSASIAKLLTRLTFSKARTSEERSIGNSFAIDLADHGYVAGFLQQYSVWLQSFASEFLG